MQRNFLDCNTKMIGYGEGVLPGSCWEILINYVRYGRSFPAAFISWKRPECIASTSFSEMAFHFRKLAASVSHCSLIFTLKPGYCLAIIHGNSFQVAGMLFQSLQKWESITFGFAFFSMDNLSIMQICSYGHASMALSDCRFINPKIFHILKCLRSVY